MTREKKGSDNEVMAAGPRAKKGPGRDPKIVGVAGLTEDGAMDTVLPLSGGKDISQWRDVNAELIQMAKAFTGTWFEDDLKRLRDTSRRRDLGLANSSLQIGNAKLDIYKGEEDDDILVKLVKFIKAVKRNNIDLFPAAQAAGKVAPAVSLDQDPSKVYWRDVISGLDALEKLYSDDDFSSLKALREMVEAGEVGQGMHLFLTVGKTHLWIKKTDDDAMIMEKIVVFMGELKQVDAVGTKGKEKPLDPDNAAIFWRDIEAALSALDGAYGNDANFKLLRLSIEKGILGTVKSFHAMIGGVVLDINQTDTDVSMRDKLAVFIRNLNKGAQVKFDEHVREKFKDLERKYRQMEAQKDDLESRYEDAVGDVGKKKSEIRRLHDANRLLEDKVRKLEAQLQNAARQQTPSPAPSWPTQTVRTYNG